MVKKLFKKYKIKAKKFYTVVILSIIEIFLILWASNWQFTLAIIPVGIQLAFIFEQRDIWARLSEEEKKEVLLSEIEVEALIKGIEKLVKDGRSSSEILEEIKKED
jgi:hypothetical protein